LRAWTDATGKFKTEAAFLDLKDGKVRLKKEDGTTITVPIERLSDADQAFARTQSGGGGPAKPTKPLGNRALVLHRNDQGELFLLTRNPQGELLLLKGSVFGEVIREGTLVGNGTGKEEDVLGTKLAPAEVGVIKDGKCMKLSHEVITCPASFVKERVDALPIATSPFDPGSAKPQEWAYLVLKDKASSLKLLWSVPFLIPEPVKLQEGKTYTFTVTTRMKPDGSTDKRIVTKVEADGKAIYEKDIASVK
jgi:hypothetical protein